MRFLFRLVLLAALAAAAPTLAQKPGQNVPLDRERITNFVSEIQVNTDASVTVTETITVVALGRQIRRGIYRDIPTDYDLPGGGRMSAGFDLLAAERGGQPENSRVESRANGVRIYLGRSDVFLDPGVYTYRITYRMTRMVGSFDNADGRYDEIYWNVTGDQWAFPIERAEARVILPQGGRIQRTVAFTGRFGERGQDFRIVGEGNGRAEIVTTRPLSPREGFTVAVAFDPGLIEGPGPALGAWYFISDYAMPIVGVLGLLGLFAFYFIHWVRVGRDPEKGTIVPRFEPPANMSPAACRYVMRMGHDKKGFAAGVLSAAVKGALRIVDVKKTGKPRYQLEKVADADLSALAPGERAAHRKLFASSDTIELKQKNHTRVRPALRSFEDAIERDYERGFFNLNRKYFYIGGGVSILLLIVIGLLGTDGLTSLFMTVWLGLWGTGCFVMARTAIRSLANGNYGTGIFMSLIMIPFFIGLIGGFVAFGATVSIMGLVFIVLIVAMNFVFFQLLKAPTRDGRKVMDEIEGFKMYLSVAEKERLAQLHPPDKTPELFEKYLPYAFALDVEQEWSEQFADILKAAGEAPGRGGYRPYWYVGRTGWSSNLAGFTTGLASGLSSNISSASTAPSKSSGSSGGGGFSGGGGGGGGGGGW